MGIGRRRATAIAGIALLGVLAGCQRDAPPPEVGPAAAAALKAHGAKDAQVDASSGDFKATITQADGGEQRIEIGAQAVSPGDFGVPYYPGATADPARTSRMTGAGGLVSTVVLVTPDAPAKVLEHYRQWLRAQAGASPSLETPGEGGAATLVLAEEAAGRATQVRIEPAGAGSEVTLLSTRKLGP